MAAQKASQIKTGTIWENANNAVFFIAVIFAENTLRVFYWTLSFGHSQRIYPVFFFQLFWLLYWFHIYRMKTQIGCIFTWGFHVLFQGFFSWQQRTIVLPVRNAQILHNRCVSQYDYSTGTLKLALCRVPSGVLRRYIFIGNSQAIDQWGSFNELWPVVVLHSQCSKEELMYYQWC